MTFDAELCHPGSGRSLDAARCIVDNGCGLAYLLLPIGVPNPFPAVPCRGFARLAQGDVIPVREAVEVTLTVAGLSRSVILRVLPSSSDDVVSVLFGRYLLDLFDIETRGASLVRLGKTVLFRSDNIRRLYDDDLGAEAPQLAEGIYDLEPHPRAPSDPVVLPLTRDDEAQLTLLLEDVVALGPVPLSHCPATMTLRPIRENDSRDTPDQRFVFEMTMRDAPPCMDRPRLYANAMFRKLTVDQLDGAKRLIDEYVAAGWWTPLPARPRDQRAAANVFAVPKGDDGKRIRLVCDLREYNKAFPSTVLFQPLIPYLLLNLRTTRGDGPMTVGDCRAAFYKVQLTTPLWVHCGTFGDFDCHRMIFGLSGGPEGLESSLGLLWRLFLSMTAGAVGNLFVDDYWLKTKAASDEARWLKLMSLCGYDVLYEKYTRTSPSQSSLSLLGVSIDFPWHLPHSVGDCNRHARLQDDFPLAEERSLQATPSDLFRIAGRLAYDPLKRHADAKVCADLVRSLVGSTVVDKSDWQRPVGDLDFGVDEPLFLHCLSWLYELVVNASQSPCQHFSPTFLNDTPLALRLCTDASHAGGAFVLQVLLDGQHVTLLEDAWIWKRAEVSYHANRLEAIGLFRGLRSLCHWLESRRMTYPTSTQTQLVSVMICSDSKSALAWARKGPVAIPDGFESRAVSRLARGLRDELVHVRLLLGENQVTLAHVAGVDNNEADRLSRILDRPVSGTSQTVVALLHKRFERRSRKRKLDSGPLGSPDVTFASDPVRRLSDSRDCLATAIARVAYDLPQALDTIGSLKLILRAWRGMGERGASARAEVTAAECLTIFVQSVQSSMTSPPLAFTHPPFSRPLGMLIHQRVDFSGNPLESFVIPASNPVCQRLILRTYHRKSHHRGVDHTFSLCLNDGVFWIQNGKRATRAVIAACLKCAKKNAKLQWSLPTNVAPRRTDLPVMSRICVDVLHLGAILVCTAMCVDTGFLVMVKLPTPTPTTESMLTCLRRVEHRFGTKVISVRLDRASGHTSRSFQLPGAQLEFTAPDTPYTNPVERLHREVRSVIRSSQFLERMVATGDEASLDEVAAIVNSRPLGMISDSLGERGILTPAGLAFGAGSHGCGTVNARTKGLRDYFYEKYFAIYRRVHQINRQGLKGQKLIVGQPALLQCKLQPGGYKICHVVDTEPPYIRIRVDGVTKLVGSAALAPLSLIFPDDDPQSPYDVQRCGARVGVTFDTDSSAGPTEFFGTVVAEIRSWDKVEIKWDPRDGMIWLNEVVDWGACRVLNTVSTTRSAADLPAIPDDAQSAHVSVI